MVLQVGERSDRQTWRGLRSNQRCYRTKNVAAMPVLLPSTQGQGELGFHLLLIRTNILSQDKDLILPLRKILRGSKRQALLIFDIPNFKCHKNANCYWLKGRLTHPRAWQALWVLCIAHHLAICHKSVYWVLNRKCGPAPLVGKLALMRLFGEE